MSTPDENPSVIDATELDANYHFGKILFDFEHVDDLEQYLDEEYGTSVEQFKQSPRFKHKEERLGEEFPEAFEDE